MRNRCICRICPPASRHSVFLWWGLAFREGLDSGGCCCRSCGAAGQVGTHVVEMSAYLIQLVTPRRIDGKTSSCKHKKRARKGIRNHGLMEGGAIPHRQALRQCFDHGHAQRPNVRRRRYGCLARFGSIVGAARRQRPVNSSSKQKLVCGDLQLFVHDQNVRGLQVAMDDAIAMKVRECIHHRLHNVFRLVRTECPMLNELRENPLRILGDDIHHLRVLNRALAAVKHRHQVAI